MKKIPSQHLAITCGDFEGAVDDNNVEAFTIAHNWEESAGPPAVAAPAADEALSFANVSTDNLAEWTRAVSDGIVGTILEQKHDMLTNILQTPPTPYMLDQQRMAIIDFLKTSFFTSI